MKNLQPEELFILASAKIEPSADEIERLNNLIPLIKKWDYMLKLAIENGMAPLVYKKIPLLSNGSMIPERVKEKLYQTYLKTFSRNMVLYEHFKLIVTAFNKANIDVIPLKGIYLAEFLYKDIGLRQLSDIDVLVKEEDAKKCVEILEQFGYKKGLSLADIIGEETQNSQHLTPMVKSGVSVEIHTKLQGSSEKYAFDINEVWSSAEQNNMFNLTLKKLSTYHLIIHLTMHLFKHYKTNKIQLNGFIDITNVLESHSNNINGTTLQTLCNKCGCNPYFANTIALTGNFFNCNLPDVYKNTTPKESDVQKLIGLIRNPDAAVGNAGLTNIRIITKKRPIKERLKIIFPPKKYMVARYSIKRGYLVPFYYLLRVGVGFKQVFQALKGA